MSRHLVTRSRIAPQRAHPDALNSFVPTVSGGGLMIGHDRHKAPVILRVLRPEPTKLAFVGGLTCAQVLVLRMIAVGARVVVQSVREPEWTVFIRQAAVGPEFLVLRPPSERLPATVPAGRPEVVVIDVGPVSWNTVPAPAPWRTTMVVRHEVVAVDNDVLSGADVTLMQPLNTAEAAIAAPVLGVSRAERWLANLHPSMLSIVSQGVVRWALLSPTELEVRTLGSPGATG